VVLIDPETCIEFKSGRCKKTCVEMCDRNAVDFTQKEEFKEIEIGTIIIATMALMGLRRTMVIPRFYLGISDGSLPPPVDQNGDATVAAKKQQATSGVLKADLILSP